LDRTTGRTTHIHLSRVRGTTHIHLSRVGDVVFPYGARTTGRTTRIHLSRVADVVLLVSRNTGHTRHIHLSRVGDVLLTRTTGHFTHIHLSREGRSASGMEQSQPASDNDKPGATVTKSTRVTRTNRLGAWLTVAKV